MVSIHCQFRLKSGILVVWAQITKNYFEALNLRANICWVYKVRKLLWVVLRSLCVCNAGVVWDSPFIWPFNINGMHVTHGFANQFLFIFCWCYLEVKFPVIITIMSILGYWWSSSRICAWEGWSASVKGFDGCYAIYSVTVKEWNGHRVPCKGCTTNCYYAPLEGDWCNCITV